jgi:hypothetical protein
MMILVMLHAREDQTYIASVTSDGLSEIARLGGESRGGCCEERKRAVMNCMMNSRCLC